MSSDKRVYAKFASGAELRARGEATDPTENDLLFGRGGATNKHPGNRRFRYLCWQNWKRYKQNDVDGKSVLAAEVVETWQSVGGRFLKQDVNGLWYVVSLKDAKRKANSTLRECKPAWAHFGPDGLEPCNKSRTRTTFGLKRPRSTTGDKVV
mmetsp:Transcript_31381/g.71829  ORF Transcript_31381/g.71829 Transcript_31381/m.71829 type:complete len:152 (+) Transcript_31381:259-714(+)